MNFLILGFLEFWRVLHQIEQLTRGLFESRRTLGAHTKQTT